MPVRTVARHLADWVARLGRVWVEGQVTQISYSPGKAFITLRDPAANVSISVTCARALSQELTAGARIVVHAKPDFYVEKGTLSLVASEIRPVGTGELLARIERLKVLLTQEGLFAPERKRPLPFLPGVIGLVTGRESAAERDVLETARRRRPAVRFEVRNVATQGALAVEQCIGAVQQLDGKVDVIVIARGGGSVEDLLPFSDEALLRAVAACRTPVVSAIGHEPDHPLLDDVADLRCSTPTDAGKRVVPDVREELQRVHQLRDRARRVLTGTVQREQHGLDLARTRPVLAAPHTLVSDRRTGVDALRDRGFRCAWAQLERAQQDLGHLRATVLALSPQSTLDRGYAVVESDAGVLRDADAVSAGAALRIRLAKGVLAATAD